MSESPLLFDNKAPPKFTGQVDVGDVVQSAV
jgi:hypothetical protein